jgi:hypothetical protein
MACQEFFVFIGFYPWFPLCLFLKQDSQDYQNSQDFHAGFHPEHPLILQILIQTETKELDIGN